MDKEAKRIAREIYAGKFSGTIDDGLTLLVAKHLSEAVTEGTGKGILEVAYNSPDYKLLRNLETNVYQFSSAKTYHQLKEMTLALKDSEGKVRSFAEFKKAATGINEKYNQNWLKTEYQTAVSSANSGARWQEYEQDKDVMPYLQYQTAGDERVRSDHALLDNVVRKINDPFWDDYYPPNGFNCRCTTVQQAHGPITREINRPELQPMFKTNLGKARLVYPQKHPYFSMPKATAKKVQAAAFRLQMKATRANVLQLAKTNLLKKTVLRKEAGGEIGFTTTGLKEAINQPHKNYLDKLRLIPHLDEVLKKAVYVKSVKYTGTDRNIKAYHYFEFHVNNQKSYINVRELKTGKLSIYSITDTIK
jgi:SPP1 gp7 family putative phage head morphogenesis protein